VESVESEVNWKMKLFLGGNEVRVVEIGGFWVDIVEDVFGLKEG
jgi:hypothetical protein